MTSTAKAIHVAMPNSAAMLCDPKIDLDTLHVGYIEGIFGETLARESLEPTRFGKRYRTLGVHKYIRFGKLNPPPAYNQTVTLRELYEAEGNFTIVDLLVEFPYEKTVVDCYNMPKKVSTIIMHRFSKWNFSPWLYKKILDRIPSYPLYEDIKRQRQKWLTRGGDKAAFRRMRSTWLVNRPVKDGVDLSTYQLWYGRGALVIPETEGEFRGRELGLGIRP